MQNFFDESTCWFLHVFAALKPEIIEFLEQNRDEELKEWRENKKKTEESTAKDSTKTPEWRVPEVLIVKLKRKS